MESHFLVEKELKTSELLSKLSHPGTDTLRSGDEILWEGWSRFDSRGQLFLGAWINVGGSQHLKNL